MKFERQFLTRIVASILIILVTGEANAQFSREILEPGQAADELQHVIGICNEIPTLETISRYQKDIDENLAVLDAIPETQPVAADYRQALDLIRQADIMYAETQQIRDPLVREERGKQESALRRKASELIKAAIELCNQLAPLFKAILERKRRNRYPQSDEPGWQRGQNQTTPNTPTSPVFPPSPSQPGNPLPWTKQPPLDGCPLPRIPVRTPIRLPVVISNIQSSSNYRATFFANYPEFEPYQKNVVVHHAVPQAVLTKYPGYFTSGEMHSINNLRGICIPYKAAVHTAITQSWNIYYASHPLASTSRIDILKEAARIDEVYGGSFDPYL